MNYINTQKRAVSPNELKIITKKSRVSVQSALKKLQKNGWLIKKGSSPKVFYEVIDQSKILNKTDETLPEVKIEEVINKNGLLEDFILKSNKISS